MPRLNTLAAVPVGLLLPFAGGYFLSYLFRTINGPISERLLQEFGLDSRTLGALSSLYFLTFAAFQIPAGLLIDRYGPRRVQACLFLVAALGTVAFALASGPATLMLGRALIGLGTSAALVTGLKAIVLWLPEARRIAANAWLVACCSATVLMAGARQVDVRSLRGSSMVLLALRGKDLCRASCRLIRHGAGVGSAGAVLASLVVSLGRLALPRRRAVATLRR